MFFKKNLGPDGRLGPSSAQASEENAQIFVMNNTNVSKKIDEKRYRSVKKATELQNQTKCKATVVTNIIA